jgi:hypothetical protein
VSAGGDSARAVLSAVGKVGVPVTNLGDSKPRLQQQQQQHAADELRWDWSEAGVVL